MLSVTGVDKNIFLNSSSIELLPIVSAEWNHNLFNNPHITVAGTGIPQPISYLSGASISGVSDSYAKENFLTYVFQLSGGSGAVNYSVTTLGNKNAYKIITYMKTNQAVPVQISSYAKGTNTQFGSTSTEINSFGWTKVETYVGSSGISDTISSLTYTISVNSNSSDYSTPNIYYTLPEVYETTYFDYQHHSMWPTESAFSYFRPGESYVPTGNALYSFPENHRLATKTSLYGTSVPTFQPISPVLNNPAFSFASAPVPILKNVLPSEMSPYKYFVSDTTDKSITAIYEQPISTNKIIFKFNDLMTTPLLEVFIDGSPIVVDSQITFSPDMNGLLILYWNGSAWTKTKWSTMPKFNSDATVSKYTTFKKITITQVTQTPKSAFSSYSSSDVINDLQRMQLIEVSPRLEIDLSDFVKTVDINKSLDSKNNYVPISSINTDDATIMLSAIPIATNNTFVPIFSSQSNLSSDILTNMLRKNIKIYVNFNLKSYYDSTTRNFVQLPNSTNPTGIMIPGGVFYSDTWDETDIKSVTIQGFDITRYLQTTPVPDYVANLKSVFEIITNILDLAGFTDYDYDSLYSICNDPASPLDLSYYFCNSKDTTIMDALAQIFLAYQIGAYIDEYGVMKFKSLSNILSTTYDSIPLSQKISLSDSNIIAGGYSITNKAKPGKISLRYQSPKIKQSLAIQNASDPGVRNSPSFIYTTSNDVVWQQQNMDSVGFNHLNESMTETSNKFKLNVNDTLDIFHTYSLNNNGYAVIENEVVSFIYKEYNLKRALDNSNLITVSVKNDLELSSEINKYIKNYQIGLQTSNGSTKANYDVSVTPTGYITNVQRGLFGTVPSAHSIISTNIANKNLSETTINHFGGDPQSPSSNTSIITSASQDPNIPNITKIAVNSNNNKLTLIYPTSETDNGYQTYSVKFDLYQQAVNSAGLFFNMNTINSIGNPYFVELIRFNTMDPNTGQLYAIAQYRYIIAISQISGGVPLLVSWAEVTGTANTIISNFEKILVKVTTGDQYTYQTASDQAFNLKVIHYPSNGEDGEDVGEIIDVFLNNVEITGWQKYNNTNNTTNHPWIATEINTATHRRKKVSLPTTPTAGTKFGFFTSTTPFSIYGITYPTIPTTVPTANLREIYATKKALKERSVSYYYQDRQFLNGLIQNQNLFSNSPSYIMQTTPEVIGINYYDIQYTTPAAVNVDVLPIEYMWYYFPGTQPADQQFYQKQLVDEYSLAYSTPINTGFRAKMAIANNSSHMIYLSKQSDQLNSFTVNLNLWTHEIVAPSDPEILEYITDPSNLSEVAQLDSVWIQSKEAANKILSVAAKGFDGFSKDTAMEIFGNPIIQVGDVLDISYTLAGLNHQKYLVHSVSQTFDQGLKTKLVLNMIDKGVQI